MNTTLPHAQVGHLIREWRQRRRLSQLDLACEADISTRHLSYVETGRSSPSREMLMHLAEQLDVPLRERNQWLTAGGFAPIYRESSLDDPSLAAARAAVEVVLRAHEPFPALALDRHWHMLSHNRAVAPLMTMVDASLLVPPVNVLRISLHPLGLASRIVNLPAWREHLFARLRQQIKVSGDRRLAELLEELKGYPSPAPADDPARADDLAMDGSAVAIPLRLLTDYGLLSFISTTTVFGTPVDITLAEIALETFFPADEVTRQALRQIAAETAETPQTSSV